MTRLQQLALEQTKKFLLKEDAKQKPFVEVIKGAGGLRFKHGQLMTTAKYHEIIDRNADEIHEFRHSRKLKIKIY